MANKLSRKEAQEVTRARLIKVATRIFTRYGFEKASVDIIAREVGMTKGAVYANFATKEDLFLAVLDYFMNQEDQMLETILVEPISTRIDTFFSRKALQAITKEVGKATLFVECPSWAIIIPKACSPVRDVNALSRLWFPV